MQRRRIARKDMPTTYLIPISNRMVIASAGYASMRVTVREENGRELVFVEVLNRASGHCEDCKALPDWRGLVVHHVEHKRMGGSKRLDFLDNLIALCARCHAKRHGIKEVDSKPMWSNHAILEPVGVVGRRVRWT